MGPMLGPIVGGLKMKKFFNKNVSIHQKEHFEEGCLSKYWLWLFGGPASLAYVCMYVCMCQLQKYQYLNIDSANEY